jgi:hypothetical protein
MFTDEHRYARRLRVGALGARTILVAGLALAFSVVLPVAVAGADNPDLLPDLVADAPTNAQAPAVVQLADGQNHLVLKFNGSIHNIGAGPLEIRGAIPVNGEMTVTGQRIYRQDSSFYDDTSRHPIIHFENTDGHDHWHFMNAARWSLWNQGGTAAVGVAPKVGFCLEDGEPVDSFASPTPGYPSNQIECEAGEPNATSVFEGISSGWRDVYGANVYFQWVDVSDVSPGRYRLGSQMDPDDFVKESNEANNGPTLATSTATVPGYVALPASASGSGPQTVTLAAQQYGSPGPRLFRIVSAPSHGSLNVAVGTPFAGPGVTYSPTAGYVGPDSFTFLAFDSASQYPFHQSVAAATVTVSRVSQNPVVARLLTGLHFSRDGRFLVARARAKLSGVLRMVAKKRDRRLGSCHKRVRSRKRFSCRLKLRKGAKPARAKVSTSLLAGGKLTTGRTYRVPRHIPRARKRGR